MLKRTLALLLLLACSKEQPLPEPTDTREPIAILYVTGPEMQVHAQPNDTAAVVATYQNGETVNVLAKKGDWTEIRTGDKSGWVHTTDLGSGTEAKQQEENPTVRFRRAPGAVTNLTARGEVYIEASVNTDGDVVDTRIITNTTGSQALAEDNAATLRNAKFYPIVRNGKREPFKYYHRVTY